MLTYILLFSLIAIVILGVVRASKQTRLNTRPQKEPFVGIAQNEILEELEEIGVVGKPRVISSNRTQPTSTMSQRSAIDTSSTVEDFTEEEIAEISELPPVDASPLFAAKPTPEPNTLSATEKNSTLNDVIVINLLANPSHPYRGYELLQAMLTVGLRYGKWGIFHRHEEITGRGPILFSLASSVEPGTFDLAKMGSFSTAGLTLFMRLSATTDPLQTFEKLLAAAQQLAEELGGTVCDEKRLPLSSEKISWWRSAL